jgi:hypothetical protein
VILELELLLMPIISSGSETATDNGYRQRHICNGSETTTNDSFEPLQMIFSIVVNVRGGGDLGSKRDVDV